MDWLDLLSHWKSLTEYLTDWESDFCKNTQRQFCKNGKITEKQKQKCLEISKRATTALQMEGKPFPKTSLTS